MHGLRRLPRPASSSIDVLPSRMLSAIVPENRWTSCSTRLNRRADVRQIELADVDAVDA